MVPWGTPQGQKADLGRPARFPQQFRKVQQGSDRPSSGQSSFIIPPPDPASEASPMSKVSHGPSSCEGLFSSGPGVGIWSWASSPPPAIKASLASSAWVCAPYTLSCRPEKPWLCLPVVQLLKVLHFILLALLILLEAPYKKLPSSHE